MTIGDRIKFLIKENDLTIYEVAEKIGTTNQNLYRILNKESIDSKYIVAISNAIGCSISLIFGEAVEEEINYYSQFATLEMMFRKVFESIEKSNCEELKQELAETKKLVEWIDNDVEEGKYRERMEIKKAMWKNKANQNKPLENNQLT